MAIVEMSKLKLIGISYERERILNALHRTGAVELRETEEIEDTRFFANADLKEKRILSARSGGGERRL